MEIRDIIMQIYENHNTDTLQCNVMKITLCNKILAIAMKITL